MTWTLVQHMHTRHSFDSLTEPRLLVQRAEELGIDVIAVTDHGTWQGSVEARECAEAAGLKLHVIRAAEFAIWEWSYSVEKALGRVRGHPIFLANPRQDLIQSGQFPDANQFPKLVTVIDLTKINDPRKFVENWQQYFWPTLKRVRQGLLTSLHKVIYDAASSSLLLFSEYVDEPRFGVLINDADMHIDGALALGFTVIRQVAALHEHGMAHNNISPGALLFKNVAATRTVVPAMIGLVEPAMGAEAMAGDCRALSAMILQWLKPNRIAALHVRIKPMFEALRTKLQSEAEATVALLEIQGVTRRFGDFAAAEVGSQKYHAM